MNGPRLIVIRVQYERWPAYGRSLGWIAPELKGAGFALVEDRTDDARPSRTWTGIVDGPTFERFAEAWRLPEDSGESGPLTPNGNPRHAVRSYVFDGLNWESDGVSPIIWVTVQVRGVNGAIPEVGRRSVEA